MPLAGLQGARAPSSTRPEVIDQSSRHSAPDIVDPMSQLELNLLVEGCRDNLVAWKATNAILDGYNRRFPFV